MLPADRKLALDLRHRALTTTGYSADVVLLAQLVALLLSRMRRMKPLWIAALDYARDARATGKWSAERQFALCVASQEALKEEEREP